MRIEDLRKESEGDRSRVCAKIVWEDADRPGRDLFFETTAPFADALTLNPNAFLLSCILPAMANGEKRIRVDGRLCPELKDNLMVATGWVRHWYGPPRRPIAIESTRGDDHCRPAMPPRAASFLSGGIDSLATLWENRMNFTPDHPRWIKDCLVLHGFDIGVRENGGKEYPLFDRTVQHLTSVANQAGVALIPVYTNARFVDDDRRRFNLEYHGAVLAAAGHAFSRRLTSVAISSSASYENAHPWGSDPRLDTHYSSTGLQVLHTGFQHSRLEKVKIVAQWPAGLANVRVCIRNPVDRVNCGRCQKCIRTMLELYAIGKLPEAATFPGSDIRVEQVRRLRWGFFRFHTHYLVELYPYLRKMGRDDLVRMIEKRRRQYTLFYAGAERLGLVELAKNIDRRYFNSAITGLLGRLF